MTDEVLINRLYDKPVIKCCIACRVPSLEGLACYNHSCRCHWYTDPIYSNKGVDIFMEMNAIKEAPKKD